MSLEERMKQKIEARSQGRAERAAWFIAVAALVVGFACLGESSEGMFGGRTEGGGALTGGAVVAIALLAVGRRIAGALEARAG